MTKTEMGGCALCLGFTFVVFKTRIQYVKMSYFFFQNLTKNLNFKCYCSFLRCKAQI